LYALDAAAAAAEAAAGSLGDVERKLCISVTKTSKHQINGGT
jgi:hypothetical protein